MAYSICLVDKIKSTSEMFGRYGHNARLHPVPNADPTKTHLNIDLKNLSTDYVRSYEDEMQYYKMSGVNQVIRKNGDNAQVMAFEVVLGFSHEEDFHVDVMEWARKSLAWAEEQFNPSGHTAYIQQPDGTVREVATDNVKSAFLHLDEEEPHLHLFIVPIDERGRLNAKAFSHDARFMSQMQDSYHRAVEEFGLKRGAKKTYATHKEIQEFHTLCAEVVREELPDVLPGESALEYRARVQRDYQRVLAHSVEQERQMLQIINEKSAALAVMAEQRSQERAAEGREAIKLARELGATDSSSLREVRKTVARAKNIEAGMERIPEDEANQIRLRLKELERLGREKRQKIR